MFSFDLITAAKFGFKTFSHTSEVFLSYIFFRLLSHIICFKCSQLFLFFFKFFSSVVADEFPLNLWGSKFHKVFWTLINSLADPDNAVAWIVFTCVLISMSPSPFTNPLGIVSSVPIRFSISTTFMFHYFFSVLKICLVGLCWVGFYGISTIVGYLMPNSFLFIQTVLFQKIKFSISIFFTQLNVRTVLFQTIYFSEVQS